MSNLILASQIDTDYVQAVAILIEKMRLDTDRLPYEDSIFDEIVMRWANHLKGRGVSIDLLDAVYNKALDIRAKQTVRMPFTIEDMLAGWNAYRENEAEKIKTKDETKFCSKCKGTGGRLEMNQNGKLIEVYCNHD